MALSLQQQLLEIVIKSKALLALFDDFSTFDEEQIQGVSNLQKDRDMFIQTVFQSFSNDEIAKHHELLSEIAQLDEKLMKQGAQLKEKSSNELLKLKRSKNVNNAYNKY